MGLLITPLTQVSTAAMPKYRSYRRRAPVRRRRGRKMTRTKYRGTRRARKSAPGGYRVGIPRQVGMQNMNPTTTTVRFVQKNVYAVTAPGGNNDGSIIQIPVADLEAPTFLGGAWAANGAWEFHGFNAFIPRYRHYVVRGAKVQLRCVPILNTPSQKKNKMYTALISTGGATQSAASTESMYEAFNSTEKNWHNSGNEVGAYDQRSYSPSRVWHIPKSNVMGNANLKCNVGTTNLPGTAVDRTFVTCTIKGWTDAATQGHDVAVVTVKATYLVTFMEHIAGTATVDTNIAVEGNARPFKRARGY